ncbi:MAG: hypothetical protein QOC96_3292 [Acidobacteriota bacterium]|jgi:hypothetical protein|nr:hypothetical protein [Acidobacteriota bacterium]
MPQGECNQSTSLQVIELFKAHVSAIVTLATGALVLSVTFLKELKPPALQNRGWLISSWVLFTASVVSGVLYSYFLTLLASDAYNKNAGKRSRVSGSTSKNFLVFFSLLLHISFVLGILTFLIFALGNI